MRRHSIIAGGFLARPWKRSETKMKKIKKMGKEGGKSRIADFFSQLIFLIFFISVKFPLIVRVD
jgi:hypothetical protein